MVVIRMMERLRLMVGYLCTTHHQAKQHTDKQTCTYTHAHAHTLGVSSGGVCKLLGEISNGGLEGFDLTLESVVLLP